MAVDEAVFNLIIYNNHYLFAENLREFLFKAKTTIIKTVKQFNKENLTAADKVFKIIVYILGFLIFIAASSIVNFVGLKCAKCG